MFVLRRNFVQFLHFTVYLCHLSEGVGCKFTRIIGCKLLLEPCVFIVIEEMIDRQKGRIWSVIMMRIAKDVLEMCDFLRVRYKCD